MADPLQERRNNWEPLEETVMEAAAPTVHNRPSLPYYQAPTSRAAPMAEMLLEAASPESDEGPLLDAAAGSFTDLVTLEVVFGNDDRVKVDRTNLQRNPWRQICALRIRSRTGKNYVGTGSFIAPNILATAGHCVFMQKEGGWAQWIEVVPAKFGNEEPFGRVRSERFASVRGWVEKGLSDYDYGVILLGDTGPGEQLGNFAVEALDDVELAGIEAKISGYPADRDRSEFQYFHARALQGVRPAKLLYDIDTFGGQSGSPIWQDTEERGLIAIGIHTTGSSTGNSGSRISADVLANLVAWTEEHPA